MASRPQSWVPQDFEDADLDPSSYLYPSSGRQSPHETQHMLAEEGVQPTRPVYGFDNAGASSSSYGLSPNHSRPTSAGSMPSHHSQDPPSESSRSSGPESGGPSLTTPRTLSYKRVTSSPLNPSFPSGPPTSSPFAHPGSRGNTPIMRMASEESRALSQGSPFALNSRSSRGSMILYRQADAQEELIPPLPPYAKRHSVMSVDSSATLSSDSKYPVGTISGGRGLVAYAWDPLMDDNEMIDEVDKLHDPAGKMSHDSGRALSARGFFNFAALIALVAALLTLFILYPVYSFFHNDGLSAAIVGNTRINSTGQASSFEFDPRSQIPMNSLAGFIDPATPQEALTRRSEDGVLYDLVFSDEFNVDERSFSKGDDPIWKAVEDEMHDSRLVATRNGYLILSTRTSPIGGRDAGSREKVTSVLQQRTTICLSDGFIEMSVASPPSTDNDYLVWSGSWGGVVSEVPTQGTSLSEIVPLQLSINSGSLDALAIDYVRFYQRAGQPPRSCGHDTQFMILDYLGGSAS
ncbi:hypothetical protein DXG01_003665 [Tephrocybe rancida]|nr:hypothetical protein DXG01_003665 [Tephrocybe rancida]